MSTIAPGRLFNVTDAASFVALSHQNWVIASEELFRRVPTNQNGSPNALNGPPTTGTWSVGDFWRDQHGAEFVCIMAGTPGTWRQTAPATVSADPASGTFPTGYLILNTTDGGPKRHAGSLSWEVQVGAGASSKVGFHGAAPTAQRANADQPAATDLASVITLPNELRAALVEKGLISGHVYRRADTRDQKGTLITSGSNLYSKESVAVVKVCPRNKHARIAKLHALSNLIPILEVRSRFKIDVCPC